jgi:hypothetical protein
VKNYRNRAWRGIFDDRNILIRITEKFPDGWHVFVGGRDVGTVASPAAARELVERINNPNGGERQS